MKKLTALFIWLGWCSLLFAQFPPLQTINPTDLVSTGPAKINFNNGYLYSNKVGRWTGSGAPGAITYAVLGDLYFDFTNQNTYGCFSASCATTPTWVKINGTGTGTGITSLNGLVVSTQVFGNDSNVTITSSGSTHQLGWSGFLSAARGGLNANASAFNGLLKMIGGIGTTAVSGSDYAPATSGTSILKGNSAGGFANAAAGTDYAPPTSGNVPLKGNNAGAFANATAADLIALWTGTCTGTNVLQANGACGTGGGGGSSTNWVLTRSSNTLYTIAPPSSGYVVETCGNKAVRATATATLSLAASSAAASSTFWVYWDCASGALKADTNANVTQANVTPTNITFGSAAASGFPNKANKVVALTAGNTAVNQFDASPTTDWQGNQSTTVVTAGTNATTTYNADGSTTVGIDTTITPQKFFGTTAPGSVSGNLPGDTFSDTTNHNDYWCNATSGTAAPACTSVTTGGWTLLNSGGSPTITDTISRIFAAQDGGGTLYPMMNYGSNNGFTKRCGNADSCGVQITNTSTGYFVFNEQLPSTWTGNLNIVIIGSCALCTGSLAARLSIATACPSNDLWDDPTYNTAQPTNTVSTTAANNQITFTLNTLTITGCSASSPLYIKIKRDNTIGSNDTGSIFLTLLTMTQQHT